MISELEMARDIALAETNAGIDVILNSDMHERTIEPIVTSTGTVIVEEGQDGTMIGELKLEVHRGKLDHWEWKPHIITDRIREDRTIAAKVAQVRKPYLAGDFIAGQQVTIGGNTTTLVRPVDEVIAYSNIDLHRSNFMNEDLPGVVEGSSHDLIADAMRWASGADTAAIRGFRYGTHIPAGGAISMEDIYHYVPVAAKLGRSPKACGADLKFQIEQSSLGTFSPDPIAWAGGWMFGYSNVSFDLDACDGFMGATPTPIGSAGAWQTFRGTNIAVGGNPIDINDPYNSTTQACKSGSPGYAVAGYWYADDPTTINNCNPCRGRLIQAVATDGQVIAVKGPGITAPLPDSNSLLDVTEAVVNYLRAPVSEGGLNGLVTAENLPLHRINVKRLPTINPYNFNVIQPLRGASAATCPTL
jgi:2',3'-cyclic-nucleotide 2'-phosphodiesterase (5'-nucleotidase family)